MCFTSYTYTHDYTHIHAHLFSDPRFVPMTYAPQSVAYSRPQDAGNLGRLKVTVCQVSSQLLYYHRKKSSS